MCVHTSSKDCKHVYYEQVYRDNASLFVVVFQTFLAYSTSEVSLFVTSCLSAVTESHWCQSLCFDLRQCLRCMDATVYETDKHVNKKKLLTDHMLSHWLFLWAFSVSLVLSCCLRVLFCFTATHTHTHTLAHR